MSFLAGFLLGFLIMLVLAALAAGHAQNEIDDLKAKLNSAERSAYNWQKIANSGRAIL